MHRPCQCQSNFRGIEAGDSVFQFPDPVIVPPARAPHELTVVFLHGRGHTGQATRDSLLATIIRKDTAFCEALCHARFVFPTAPLTRATKYRRSLVRQWYDGTGDWEPEARGSMRPSIDYIRGLIRTEIEILGGNSRKVVLAGFSQGCAMALVSLLLWEGDPLGAVVGMSGFIPLNTYLMDILESSSPTTGDVHIAGGIEWDDNRQSDSRGPLQVAIDELRQEAELPIKADSTLVFPFQSTPVFLGHGTADKSVELRHGQQLAALLAKMGIDVEFRTYQGLEHKLSSDMLNHVADFVSKVSSR
ncbi:hypothetical protein HIM_05936 [Hirsutella minnesotensis 3608]|uniref:Phospholipase/carboxylesterase/thioesterase domain-containing protein n=1 Tax=Hirsutella minnesotensis 3608 TaxID=1043627 RepID=A0A0F7ZJP1_9HYPO|nr:hypothetical protein HIM_05936 [Hirsutella minnesotensis 3608]